MQSESDKNNTTNDNSAALYFVIVSLLGSVKTTGRGRKRNYTYNTAVAWLISIKTVELGRQVDGCPHLGTFNGINGLDSCTLPMSFT